MADAVRKGGSGPLTYKDLWQTPADGNRHEVMAGEAVVSPPPSVAHQAISLNLVVLLHQHVVGHGLGRVLEAPIGVVLEKATAVQPDIIFVSKGRLSIIQEKAVVGAPDLVIEILSPSTAARDRNSKKSLYARTGVRHYWIVDPRRRILQAWLLGEDGYAPEAEVTGERPFRPSLFPGLVILLKSIWA